MVKISIGFFVKGHEAGWDQILQSETERDENTQSRRKRGEKKKTTKDERRKKK